MSAAENSFKIEPRSLQAEVLDRLREEIIRGVWKPGVRLQERLLCARFGISRSPLREAFQVLATEGLLVLMRNRGAVVSTPTYEETMNAFILLETLEMLGLELACTRASDNELADIGELHRREVAAASRRDEAKAFQLNNQLHRAIVEASHNRALMDAHLIVSRQIIRVQNATAALRPHLPADEHVGFITPLLKRQKAPALKGLRTHLAHARDNAALRIDALAAGPEKTARP